MSDAGNDRMQKKLARLLGLPSLAAVAVLLVAQHVGAGTIEVTVKLPVRAQIDLEDRDSVTFTPFLVVSREGDDDAQRRGVDVQREFERYLKKILRRYTDLELIEPGAIDYPTYDLDELSRNVLFWSAVGERTGADIVLSGSLDFDIQDKSGYRTEEYVSPVDSRTYYRQVLVEQTGFEYDIVMQIFDGRTGRLMYSDNFKDFKKFEGESADPLAGMFENLRALEDRIAGVFAQKEVETTRTLFTD